MKVHPQFGGQGQRPPEAAQAVDTVIREQGEREAAESARKKAAFDKHNGPNWQASKPYEASGNEVCVHPLTRRVKI